MRALLISTVLAGLACGPVSIDGSVKGERISASDAISNVTSVFGSQVAVVIIASSPDDLCRDVSEGGFRSDGSRLTLTLFARGALTPGEYPVRPPGEHPASSAALRKWDSGCNALVEEVASGGRVVVDEVEGSEVRGTFNLAFGEDVLSGSFRSSRCAFGALDVIPRVCL